MTRGAGYMQGCASHAHSSGNEGREGGLLSEFPLRS